MYELTINFVAQQMQPHLDCNQLKILRQVLFHALSSDASGIRKIDNEDLLDEFLKSKEVEGCSWRTLKYYRNTLMRMGDILGKEYSNMTTDDLRSYLNDYERDHHISKITLENIRRIMSTFFAWLEDEDFIIKSPVRRIRKVKITRQVKETLTDENMEALRDACETARDRAILDLLASTGMRVGELVMLNITDLNMHERECVVVGKGNKERVAYFDARTKLHLQEYLATRSDCQNALFVTFSSPCRRLSITAVEERLRRLGQVCGVKKVHPHKFRRTFATHAIDKGMPIEQVQRLLGHERIETTMQYAMVNQGNVKASHRRYMG